MDFWGSVRPELHPCVLCLWALQRHLLSGGGSKGMFERWVRMTPED